MSHEVSFAYSLDGCFRGLVANFSHSRAGVLGEEFFRQKEPFVSSCVCRETVLPSPEVQVPNGVDPTGCFVDLLHAPSRFYAAGLIYLGEVLSVFPGNRQAERAVVPVTAEHLALRTGVPIKTVENRLRALKASWPNSPGSTDCVFNPVLKEKGKYLYSPETILPFLLLDFFTQGQRNLFLQQALKAKWPYFSYYFEMIYSFPSVPEFAR